MSIERLDWFLNSGDFDLDIIHPPTVSIDEIIDQHICKAKDILYLKSPVDYDCFIDEVRIVRYALLLYSDYEKNENEIKILINELADIIECSIDLKFTKS